MGKKPKTPKKKKKKDPNEPQKPVSAYALFFRDTQAAIKGQNPNATFGEVSKIVASMLDGLGDEQKQVRKDTNWMIQHDLRKCVHPKEVASEVVGCVRVCVCVCMYKLQSCPTLCDPADCSLPSSSVHEILQTRILESVAIPSSRGIFLTQGSNLYLVCLQQKFQESSLPLAPPGKPGHWVNSSDTRTEAENVPHQNQTSGDSDMVLHSSIALL